MYKTLIFNAKAFQSVPHDPGVPVERLVNQIARVSSGLSGL
jgi:hypothetical protein